MFVLGCNRTGAEESLKNEETLVFPGTEQPVAQFMWSIGHTIRPNGEILEGNAAAVVLETVLRKILRAPPPACASELPPFRVFSPGGGLKWSRVA